LNFRVVATRLDLLRRAANRYGFSIPAVLWRTIAMRRKGYGFQESVRAGLLDPTVSSDALNGCLDGPTLTAVRNRVNPIQYMALTEDKATFHTYCRGIGLAAAPILAVFDKSWTRERCAQFLKTIPDEFVTKPALGGHGSGLVVYRKRPTTSELYDRLSADRFHQVIQPRFQNHPDMIALSGTDALQTVRIVTWLTPAGDVEIYLTLLKIIVGKNLHDNFNFGLSGNLTANIDPVTGILDHATGASGDGIAFQFVPKHPTTQRQIAGFRLPHWSATRELACHAAKLFLPIRTIGWDIAITAAGPLLIEANARWDTFNHLVVAASPQRQRQLAAVAALIRNALAEVTESVPGM
jgi:hypothetical protein